MALTGIFLVVFLVVHCYVNANIFFSNAEENFNRADKLTLLNRATRKSRYAVTAGNKTSKWYSRSMALLGTLILLFLIVHLAHFWVPSRFGGLKEVEYGGQVYHNLYGEMKDVFSQPWAVILYLLGCFSLAWHLLHGIQSAAQTLGWTNKNFMPMITNIGIVFSILVPAIFALMPVFMYFGWEINTGALTLLF